MRTRTFGSVLNACAQSYGEREALVHGSDRLTYGEAIGRVRATGRALRSQGLKPGNRIALLIEDSPEMVDALYGALWAGLTVVPLNPRLSGEDHAYMLADCEARALVFSDYLSGRAEELLERAEVPLVFGTSGSCAVAGGRSLADLGGRQSTGPGEYDDVDPAAEVWIQYTGGTTGAPKGAVHSHETMLSALLGCTLEYDIQPDEVWAHVTPLTHSGAAAFLPVWMRGGTNLLIGGFDAAKLRRAIEDERVTATLMVPTMITTMLDAGEVPDRSRSDLRTILYGAAPITPSLLRRAIEAFGPVFVQGYGQTEAFSQITTLTKADHARGVERPEVLASAGRPVAIAEVRVAAGDDSIESAPVGETGEVLVHGPHVILGYLNKPEETATALDRGWLRTGDVGRFDEEGYLYLVDRKKDMIISGGFNVYPKEVEQALDLHPAVREACVFGIPDERWGEAVKAVVVVEEEVEEEAIIAFVKDRKGSVLAPKSVDFVDALPQTSLGKIDKKALRSVYWTDQNRAIN